MPRICSLLLLLLLAIANAASAADDGSVCGDRQADDAERQAACTRAITSGALDGPALAMAHFNRAKTHERRGDLDAALADWTQAIRARPDAAILYVERGSLLVEMKDFERASADLDEALRLDPNSRLAHFWRAALSMARAALEARLAPPEPTKRVPTVAIPVDPLPAEPQRTEAEPTEPKAAQAQPAEEKKCITIDTDFKQVDKTAAFVIALTNNCEKRTRCTVNAYVVNSLGPNTGRAVLTLAAKSKGAAAHKSYVMKVKQAGGMASVSHSCTDL